MDTALVRDYIASYLKKNPPEMIKRDLSVSQVRGKATVIIGPRRAGKTYFLWQEILKYDRSETLYLDFEDIALMDLKPSEILLLIKDIFTEISSKSVKVLFLDEIQNVVGWESLVRSLLDRGYILFITGSTSILSLFSGFKTTSG